MNPASPYDWLEHRTGGPLRGVALVMHGLNLDPQRMRPVAELLTGDGLDVLNLSLRGHGANFAPCDGVGETRARLRSFRAVTGELWEAEARSACELARERARQAGVQLVGVGYSLGALLAVALQAVGAGLDRMVLFAPPLSLPRWQKVLLPLTRFPRLMLPSLARGVLANPFTPMAAYKALLETFTRVTNRSWATLDIPTLVVIDPGDELVSFRGVDAVVRARGLQRWRFHTVRKDPGVTRGIPRHLLVDERWVGPAAWAGIRRAVTDHLARGPA